MACAVTIILIIIVVAEASHVFPASRQDASDKMTRTCIRCVAALVSAASFTRLFAARPFVFFRFVVKIGHSSFFNLPFLSKR